MQLVTVLFGVVTLLGSVSASAIPQYKYNQAVHFTPHLAPRLSDGQAQTKTLVTRADNKEKNFTHNELFALQKKFLDNFVYPANTLQVRFSVSDL